MTFDEHTLQDSSGDHPLAIPTPAASSLSRVRPSPESSSNATASTATMRDSNESNEVESEIDNKVAKKHSHSTSIKEDKQTFSEPPSSRANGMPAEKVNIHHSEDIDRRTSSRSASEDDSCSSDNTSSSSSEYDRREGIDGIRMDHRQQPHLPRQGLPSFWYALKRLNLTDPRSIIHSLNFFRWHVIIGIVVPLITAGIFCACNTQVTFAYIDALFMCTSALTLTGLSSILLGDMSFGQQFILYLLLQFGSIQFVSLLVLFVRRSTFSKKFDPKRSFWPHKSIILKDEEFDLANDILEDPDEVFQLNENGLKRKRRKKREKRQRDGVPENGRSKNGISDSNGGALSRENGEIVANSAGKERRKRDAFKLKRMNSPLSMQSEDYASHPLPKQTKKHSKIEPISSVNGDVEPVPEGTSTSSSSAHPNKNPRARARQRTLMPSNTESSNLRKVATTRNAEGRTGTTVSQNTAKSSAASRHHTYPHPHHRHHHQSSRGGFPNPIQAIFSEGVYQLKKRSNSTARYRSSGTESGSHTTGNGLLHGNTGFPRTDTLFSRRSGLGRVGTRLATSREMTEGDLENGATDNGGNRSGSNNQRNDDAKPKRQVSLPASAYRFGRNSTVKDLSRDAHQKLAQLEISGMTLLMYIIITWWIGLQLLFVIIWSPYFEAGKFDEVFQQYNPNVSRTWFSVFQSASMLNNSGLSLVDGSLVPFRTCYIMLVPGVFLMIIGNLGYPISLRFTIWLVHACLRATSKLRFITSFMLAHPRRIFYYIFPPYETRALFLVVMLLTAIDWGCFFLLDVGFTSPVFSISTGVAVLSGLVQSVAVRSAGFYTVPLYQVAPALDMLYLFMMAFCVYPLALAIRATNVYEERSLGIAHDDEQSPKDGLFNLRRETGYSKFHLREQLAYDVWYILLAYWLICIVERNNIGITGADPAGSIDMFAILFEVTSAYANVGFSIGSPTVDTSISGDLRHLSKLILCATMIRGRTRGLPVLVDRAVLTPRQLARYGDPADGGFTDEEDT